MKISSKLILSIVTFTLSAVPNHDLVFASFAKQDKRVIDTCSELQRRANKAWRNDNTVFQGFENLPVDRNATISNAGDDRLCQLGYITRITPMGKEVCQGYLYTNINLKKIHWGYGYRQRTIWDDPGPRSDYCRYIN
jgi:hypothetical protein